VLVVDDDQVVLDLVRLKVQRQCEAVEVVALTDASRVSALLAYEQFDAVITDWDMSPVGGESVLRSAREASPCMPLAVLTGGDVTRVQQCAGAIRPALFPKTASGVSDLLRWVDDTRRHGTP
jgi:DNA-binding NtrC family response regulator